MTRQDETLLRLIEVGRTLVSELNHETVLARILEGAREITGARYAALGVLSEDREHLARFLTSGIDKRTRRRIGELPTGRGVLGVLITDPRALMLTEVGSHGQSFGFPPGHPPMHTFLGMPIVIRGQAWGNLYLTEKAGGEPFTAADQDAATILAQWASTALENSRLYEDSEDRRAEAERAVRALQAAQDIADAIGSVADLEQVLKLVVERGRTLVHARSIVIMLRDGDQLAVAAGAGDVRDGEGRHVPIAGSSFGAVLEGGRSRRLTRATAGAGLPPTELGVTEADSALLVPMHYRRSAIGVLAAFDTARPGVQFSVADEQLLRTFAASAANAVAVKRSVDTERLRATIAAADAERRRWARDLHDQTLQALGGLRVGLASALRRGDPEGNERAIRQAIEDIEVETDNLRGIITDLRPSILDDLGLRPALDALIERRRNETGLVIEADVDLGAAYATSASQRASTPLLAPDLETTVYRLVQESLSNVAKHARASRCQVRLRVDEDAVTVDVSDDGIGFDPARRSSGFGVAGMEERVYIAGGILDISSGGDGTSVRARIPVRVG
jgi:signal transduction histidine kinase